MRRFLLIYAAVATVLLIGLVVIADRQTKEIGRLNNNCVALASEAEYYQTRLDESAASVVALQHTVAEYREQHKQDAKRIRALGVRLRRVESVATNATKSEVKFVAPRHDTIILRDTLSLFRWSDSWVRIEGIISDKSVECQVESVDTLRQVIHRVPHRWWIFRYGTKAIRQEITSSNPHTRIVYSEYIELPKRRRRR